MSWQSPMGMDEYLRPTALCDCDNCVLKEKAFEITEGAEVPKEAAIRIFYFVRDKIAWGADFLDAKASDTLKRGMGLCMNKANLQIALLRAAGIPARYHRADLKKESLKGLILNIVYKGLPSTISAHSWCECYLFERWVSCEATLDETLYQCAISSGLYSKQQIPTIEWNGESHLILMTPWLSKDFGTSSSIDDTLKEAQLELLPPKPITRMLCLLSNRFVTDKLREGKIH
ncbi:MAG TPA: transglutaminase domain-containing protein [Dehalococcoidia bacterium]|nr:transglutaminase domain-containing protein [Dehalococcoidia bacterium]